MVGEKEKRLTRKKQGTKASVNYGKLLWRKKCKGYSALQDEKKGYTTKSGLKTGMYDCLPNCPMGRHQSLQYCPFVVFLSSPLDIYFLRSLQYQSVGNLGAKAHSARFVFGMLEAVIQLRVYTKASSFLSPLTHNTQISTMIGIHKR